MKKKITNKYADGYSIIKSKQILHLPNMLGEKVLNEIEQWHDKLLYVSEDNSKMKEYATALSEIFRTQILSIIDQYYVMSWYYYKSEEEAAKDCMNYLKDVLYLGDYLFDVSSGNLERLNKKLSRRGIQMISDESRLLYVKINQIKKELEIKHSTKSRKYSWPSAVRELRDRDANIKKKIPFGEIKKFADNARSYIMDHPTEFL